MKKLQTISTIFFLALLIVLSISLGLKANSTNSKQCSIWPDKSLTPSIINTLSTLQFYGPQPGFHHGLDLQAPAVTAVYAPVTGAVATRYYYERVKNPYTYEISISTPDGERWEFHHIDKNSIPESIEKLADQKSVVKCGTYLGQVFNAPQLYPEILAHIHINVINSEGYYLNAITRKIDRNHHYRHLQ